jgi:hypothetical protein
VGVYGGDWRLISMTTKLLMEIRNIIADLASTLILGKNKDAANLAIILSEKSKALAEELAK